MPVSDDAVLYAAINIGERSAQRAIKYALMAHELRVAMRASIHLLETGKVDQAKTLLEKALK